MRTYVINAIAFDEELKKDVQQANFIGKAKTMGFDAFEIRSEFLSADPAELDEIKQIADKEQMSIFYSVNDLLYRNGQLNVNLNKYIRQMHRMGSTNIKLNLGKLSFLDSNGLADLLDGSFTLRIENNQTVSESDLDTLTRFFKLLEGAAIPHVRFCFDIANWSWLAATANEAVSALKDDTDYVHLKNEAIVDQRRQVTHSLRQGDLDWQS
ncbi:MAG TPA: hypothetical protein DCW31_08570, partial [Lactobacillus sp.]|nr:hypothetical protein [Lactobacillus sp.]